MTRSEYRRARRAYKAWNHQPANRAGSFENRSGPGRVYRASIPWPFLKDFTEREQRAITQGTHYPHTGRLPAGPLASAFAAAAPAGGPFKGRSLRERASIRAASKTQPRTLHD